VAFARLLDAVPGLRSLIQQRDHVYSAMEQNGANDMCSGTALEMNFDLKFI
jgi:hypothetical protein